MKDDLTLVWKRKMKAGGNRNELGQTEQMQVEVLACFVQAPKNMMFSSLRYRLINKNGKKKKKNTRMHKQPTFDIKERMMAVP